MKTVAMLSMLVLVMVCAALNLASAQQGAAKLPTIGILSSGSASDPRYVLRFNAFRDGLASLGYVDGKSIKFEHRHADARSERLPQLAKELVGLRVAILFAIDNRSVRAAKAATTTIPIIIAIGTDPVAVGLVASLARPGGNVTGLTTLAPQLVEKRLGLLKEALPKVTRFGYLMPANSENVKANFDEAQGTAKVLGVTFQSVVVKAPNPDFDGAFRYIVKERIGGLITEGAPLLAANRKKILALAAKYRVPAIHTTQQWSSEGGLMSYGANDIEPFQRAAVFVDKILKGTKPADLPIERPMKFEFVINLRTALALNLAIPQSVLYRADKVIK